MPHGLLTLTPYPRPDSNSTHQAALLTTQASGVAGSDARGLAHDLGVCSPAWLRTGCLHAPQPGNVYSILVMPVPPDSTKRHNTYHAGSPAVAPSLALYIAYRAKALSWQDFALTYLAELDARRHGALAGFVEQLSSIPARYAGVLLLGFRQAPGGNEARVLCTRRLLRAWLLNEVGRLPEMQRSTLRPLPLQSPPWPHSRVSPHLQLQAC